MNKTYSAKPESIERAWHIVDAANVPIGRLAAQVAQVLRGKHKPTFTYNQDCGDFVVVINADKAVWTGTKAKELLYWHTGWPGGLRNISRGELLETNSVRAIEKVAWGMIPKVYAGSEHPHEAQNPQPLNIGKK